MTPDASNPGRARPFTPREGIRARPGMYIGSTDAAGLLTLTRYLIDFLIPDVGTATDDGTPSSSRLDVELLADGAIRVTVPRGGPTGPVGPEACVLPELLQGPQGHLSNAWWVAALASRLVAEVSYPHGTVAQELRRGVLAGPATPTWAGPGVRVTFWPDPTIFLPGARIDQAALLDVLRVRAATHPGLRAHLRDDRSTPARSEEVHLPGGAADLLRLDTATSPLLHPELCTVRARVGGVQLDAALGWSIQLGRVRGLVGTHPTSAGTHISGLRAGCLRPVREYLAAHPEGPDEPPCSPDDIRAGLVACVAIRHPAPQFQAPTLDNLSNPEVAPFVRDAVARALRAFLTAHPGDAARIAEEVRAARDFRLAKRRK